jgi:hypothetical protein
MCVLHLILCHSKIIEEESKASWTTSSVVIIITLNSDIGFSTDRLIPLVALRSDVVQWIILS